MHETADMVLTVDLSEGTVHRSPLDQSIRDSLLGGAGAALHLLWETMPVGSDPLSAESAVVLGVGALVGTPYPGAAKVSAAFRSPVLASVDGMHWIGCSVAGGRDLGLALRGAGIGYLVIKGRSSQPVYLSIEDGEARLESAADLWGRADAEETAQVLKARYGGAAGVITIGPAGENGVRFAMAFVDQAHSLGRGGFGAVLGSKGLKAVVVRGTKGISAADPERLLAVASRVRDRVAAWPGLEKWSKLGMGAGWSIFQYTQYPGKWPRSVWDRLYGEHVRAESVDQLIACAACAMGCRIKWRIKGGRFDGEVGHGSPFGKSATSGQLLDVADYRDMLHLVTVCNRLGMCFYTFTRMVDWLTNLYRDGRLTRGDTGGVELRRTFDCYEELAWQTAKREGVGRLIAEGWVGVQRELGLDPQEYWYGGICKGTDFIYDARAAKVHPLMLMFVTNPRPHHGGGHSLSTGPGKTVGELIAQMREWGAPVERLFREAPVPEIDVGRCTKYVEDAMMVRNMLGVCSMYSAFGMERMGDLAEAYAALTGRDVGVDGLMEAGERAFNLKKLLNAREGFNRRFDAVPRLWLRPMVSPEGVEVCTDYFRNRAFGEKEFEEALTAYYQERGWDPDTGLPKREKFSQLGLTRYL